ncbi:MAG: translation initiation factor IF-2 [Deltaproteobacteria bacterium]|nr:translation initiation factor IF-2 [Deltaproteobacteria bacterium]
MTRMRVHELAKELNMNNKDLLDRLIKLGIQVKNHMSVLTEPALQKIRQQFTDAKAEKLEEKRIGRQVIRRRKRVVEEEAKPLGVLSQEVEVSVSTVESLPPLPEIPLPSSEEEMAPPAPGEAAVPSAVSAEVKGESAEELREAAVEVVETVALSPAATTVEEIPSEIVPFPPEPSSGPVLPERAETEPPIAEPAPTDMRETPFERAVSELPTEEAPAAPAVVEEISEAAAAELEEVPPAVEEEEEEEGKLKPKKAKKKRRKKTPKDEPARIIRLPEIIPEEPQEEVEVLEQLVPRIHVIAEDEEAREIARKKRPKPEELKREAPDSKRRGLARKEVFEREDLYSKKELAAQADRGRFRDRDRLFLKEAAKPELAVAKPGKRKIRIDEAITVANLAKQMGVKGAEVIKKLLLLGVPSTINQALDFETASLLAADFGYEVEQVGFEEEEILQVQEDRSEDMVLRPPVVTVMGHVDHGKTSLLDAIRDTNVIEGEAGGITQHIGAYFVKLESGDVVFLDTPGHEAFTSMRARGAKVTDLVILVVAADDGVMQQTVEAINHAKAAKVPIVVAINKIDKPNANVDRVKRELAEQGLIPEEWGGDTTMVEISAKKRQGIEELLEMVLLQAEILELKANPNKPARGRVIEAKLDKGRGPVATILIQEGTLKAGDVYVCGVNSGRVRNMFSDRGQRLEIAGPSTPVEVLGFSGVPNAGDDFVVLADEKQAKLVAEHRLLKQREKELTKTSKVTLESLFEQIQVGEVKELNVILKADVHGSLEAITDSLLKLSTPEVKVNLIHSGTGAITETDIMLASASNAIVIGFNMRADSKVQELADQEKVDLRYYDVIYQLLNEIKDAMVGMLEPVYQENVLGRAEVRQTFHVPKIGTIAGSYILDGQVVRGAKVRVLRDQVVIYDGKIGSLRRFKDDVKEVKAGFECGIGIDNFNDIKVSDILEAYELQEIKPTLESEGEKKPGN